MKIILTLLACIMLNFIASAQVAVDSTRNIENVGEEEPKALPQSTTQAPQYQDDIVQAQEGNSELTSDELPGVLRKALESKEYKGWEKGKVYFNSETNTYHVSVPSGDKMKTYAFDKSGKRLKQ